MGLLLVKDQNGVSRSFPIAGAKPTKEEAQQILGVLRAAPPSPENSPMGALGAGGEFLRQGVRGFAEGFTNIPAGLAGLAYSAGLTDLDPSKGEGWAARQSRSASDWLEKNVASAGEGGTAGQIGYALGNIGSFIVPGAVVGKGAAALGAGTAAIRGAQLAGASIPAVSLGAADQVQRLELARKNGLDISDGDAKAAIALGGLIGTADVIPVARLMKPLNQLFRFIPKQATSKAIETITGRLLSAGKQGLLEGSQELLSGIAQDLTEQGFYNPDLEIGQSAANDFGIGGGAGAIFDFALNTIAGRKLRSEKLREKELAEQLAQDVAEQQGYERRMNTAVIPPPPPPVSGLRALEYKPQTYGVADTAISKINNPPNEPLTLRGTETGISVVGLTTGNIYAGNLPSVNEGYKVIRAIYDQTASERSNRVADTIGAVGLNEEEISGLDKVVKDWKPPPAPNKRDISERQVDQAVKDLLGDRPNKTKPPRDLIDFIRDEGGLAKDDRLEGLDLKSPIYRRSGLYTLDDGTQTEMVMVGGKAVEKKVNMPGRKVAKLPKTVSQMAEAAEEAGFLSDSPDAAYDESGDRKAIAENVFLDKLRQAIQNRYTVFGKEDVDARLKWENQKNLEEQYYTTKQDLMALAKFVRENFPADKPTINEIKEVYGQARKENIDPEDALMSYMENKAIRDAGKSKEEIAVMRQRIADLRAENAQLLKRADEESKPPTMVPPEEQAAPPAARETYTFRNVPSKKGGQDRFVLLRNRYDNEGNKVSASEPIQIIDGVRAEQKALDDLSAGDFASESEALAALEKIKAPPAPPVAPPVPKDQKQMTADQYAAALKPVANAVQSVVNKMVPGVKVRLESFAKLDDTVTEGIYETKREGAVNRLIRLSTAIYDPNLSVAQLTNKLIDVAGHEILHAAREMGYFTKQQWADVVREASQAKMPGRKKITYMDVAQMRYAGVEKDVDVIQEEAVADMFRDYLGGRYKPRPASKGVFGKIADLVRRLFGGMRAGKIDDIFGKLSRGELVGSGPAKPAASSVPISTAASVEAAYKHVDAPWKQVSALSPEKMKNEAVKPIKVMTDHEADLVKKHMALEAWLGRRSVLGQFEDRFGRDSGGVLVSVENGDILGNTTTDDKVKLSPVGVPEITSYRDPALYPREAKLFGSMSSVDIGNSINLLRKFDDATIDRMFPAELRDTLKKRRDWLFQWQRRNAPSTATKSIPSDAYLSEMPTAERRKMAIKAFHGSPHDFDKFDMSKIGTGEGAQAYGHGLYFAENEGVAKSYRDQLAKSTIEFDDKLIDIKRKAALKASLVGQRVPPIADNELTIIQPGIAYAASANVVNKIMNAPLKLFGKNISKEATDSALIKIQDFFLPVARLIDNLAMNNGVITDANNAYLKNDLMTGAIAAKTEDNEKTLFVPLLDVVKGMSVSDADIAALKRLGPVSNKIMTAYDKPGWGAMELYLYARHAEERNAFLANVRKVKKNSGMETGEARDVMAWFNANPMRATFENAAAMFDKIIADTKRVRLEGGLNPDFDAMSDPTIPRYKFYAPLRGALDEDLDADTPVLARIGRGFKIRGREDQLTKGRESTANSILGSAIVQNLEAIVRAEKNKVGQSFLRLVRDHQALLGESGWDIVDLETAVPMKVRIDKNGVLKAMPSMDYKNQPDYLVVKENGKEIAMKINDPRLARALNNAGANNSHAFIRGIGKVTRLMSSLATTFNPEFLISNAIRDVETALINIGAQDIKDVRKRILANLKPSFSAVRNAVRNNDFSGEMGQAFAEMRKLGALTGLIDPRSLEDQVAKMQRYLERDNSGALGKSRQAVDSIIKTVSDYNTVFENMTRLAIYKASVDGGISKEKAADIAKNTTVNFNRGGEWRGWLNPLYMFFNASLQGTFAMAASAGRSKSVRRTLAGIMVAGIMSDLIMSALSPEDEDGESIYDKIPEFRKQRNLIIVDPFGLTDRGYIAIPMPYGYSAIFNFGRVLGKTARGKASPIEGATSAFSELFDNFNPFGASSNVINMIMPTVVDPVVDLTVNTDFFGKPIYPEASPFGVSKPASQLYWGNTAAPYIAVADFFSKMTGGTDVIPGAIEFSPNHLQYIIEYFGSGAASFVRRVGQFTTESVPALIQGDMENFSVNDIPFVRRIYGQVTEKEDLSRFSERRNEILTIGRELDEARKYGDHERLTAVRENYADELSIYPQVKALNNKRNQILSKIRQIEADPRIDEDSKQDRLKVLREQATKLASRINSLYVQRVETAK